MKLNYSYIKEMLLVIESQPEDRPYLSSALKSIELENVNQDFVLHYEVLLDCMLIASASKNGSIGISQGFGGEYNWSDIPIRLTAIGNEFIDAINTTEI